MTATNPSIGVSMPASDGDALRRLLTRLDADHDEQRREVAELEALLEELIDGDDDTTGHERELVRASLERAREALEETAGAIARFSVGTYGLCESCGRPIPVERLEALPQTRHCVACLGRGGGQAGRLLR